MKQAMIWSTQTPHQAVLKEWFVAKHAYGAEHYSCLEWIHLYYEYIDIGHLRVIFKMNKTYFKNQPVHVGKMGGHYIRKNGKRVYLTNQQLTQHSCKSEYQVTTSANPHPHLRSQDK